MGKARMDELFHELYSSSKRHDSWQRYAMIVELRSLMNQPKESGSDHVKRALNDEELVEPEVATELNGIEDRAVENEANTKMISAKVKEESIPQSKVSIPQSNSEIVRSIEPGKVDLELEKLEHVVMNENLAQDWVQKDVKVRFEADGGGKTRVDQFKLVHATPRPGVYDRPLQNRVWDSGGSKIQVFSEFDSASFIGLEICGCETKKQTLLIVKLANHVWKPGGFVHPKIQLDWLERADSNHEKESNKELRKLKLHQGRKFHKTWMFKYKSEFPRHYEFDIEALFGVELSEFYGIHGSISGPWHLTFDPGGIVSRTACDDFVVTNTQWAWHCVKHDTQQADFHVWHRWKNKAEKLEVSLVCSGKRWSLVVYAFYDHTVVGWKEPILSPKIKRGFENKIIAGMFKGQSVKQHHGPTKEATWEFSVHCYVKKLCLPETSFSTNLEVKVSLRGGRFVTEQSDMGWIAAHRLLNGP